jgi:hypothetical protein
VNPTVAGQLKAYNLATIADRLQTVAEAWLKLCVEHLPVRDKTVELLQVDYRDLMEALPVSEPAEIEVVLRRYTRGLRLREGHHTATQGKLLTEVLGLGPYRVATDTYEYVAPLSGSSESPARGCSAASVLYIASHRSLGVLWPTCTDEFRDHLCAPQVQQGMVDSRGAILLEPLLREHSRWLARIIEQQKAVTSSGGEDDLAHHDLERV